MIEEAIILAGGLGTRLRGVIKDIPKPMADINGKPFLEYLLFYLNRQGLKKIVLSVGYKYNIIKDYFGDFFLNTELLYSIEDEPLKTGGAILKALNFVNGKDVFILNGDTLFKINLYQFYEFHSTKDSKLTISLKPTEHPDRYGIVDINNSYRIMAFFEKGQKEKGLINGGIYLLNKEFFLNFDLPDKFSFEKDFLEKCYKDYEFYGFPSDSYFIDIGIPEDYERAKRDIENLKFNNE